MTLTLSLSVCIADRAASAFKGGFNSGHRGPRPIYPHLKLLTQQEVLGLLCDKIPRSNEERPDGIHSSQIDMVIRKYTFEDANRHLAEETDVQWRYTENQKYDSWLP